MSCSLGLSVHKLLRYEQKVTMRDMDALALLPADLVCGCKLWPKVEMTDIHENLIVKICDSQTTERIQVPGGPQLLNHRLRQRAVTETRESEQGGRHLTGEPDL